MVWCKQIQSRPRVVRTVYSGAKSDTLKTSKIRYCEANSYLKDHGALSRNSNKLVLSWYVFRCVFCSDVVGRMRHKRKRLHDTAMDSSLRYLGSLSGVMSKSANDCALFPFVALTCYINGFFVSFSWQYTVGWKRTELRCCKENPRRACQFFDEKVGATGSSGVCESHPLWLHCKRTSSCTLLLASDIMRCSLVYVHRASNLRSKAMELLLW